MFAILVQFDVEPPHRNTLLDSLRSDRGACLREEPGTVRFDILEDASDPRRLFLYEVYEDEAAFEAHKQRSPYKTAMKVWGDLTSGGSVTITELGRGQLT